MNDFFGALELELREAGQRSPRRRTRPGDVAGVVAAAALLAAAVIMVLVVIGGGEPSRTAPVAVKPNPVGTVIPKGEARRHVRAGASLWPRAPRPERAPGRWRHRAARS